MHASEDRCRLRSYSCTASAGRRGLGRRKWRAFPPPALRRSRSTCPAMDALAGHDTGFRGACSRSRDDDRGAAFAAPGAGWSFARRNGCADGAAPPPGRIPRGGAVLHESRHSAIPAASFSASSWRIGWARSTAARRWPISRPASSTIFWGPRPIRRDAHLRSQSWQRYRPTPTVRRCDASSPSTSAATLHESASPCFAFPASMIAMLRRR